MALVKKGSGAASAGKLQKKMVKKSTDKKASEKVSADKKKKEKKAAVVQKKAAVVEKISEKKSGTSEKKSKPATVTSEETDKKSTLTTSAKKFASNELEQSSILKPGETAVCKIDEAADHLKSFFEKQSEGDLFADGKSVQCVFSLAEIPSRQKHKAQQIRIPNPMHKESEVCVIVKDDFSDFQKKDWEIKSKVWKTLVKDAAEGEDSEIPQVKKVIPLKKLRDNYKTFAQKRDLLNLYDVFLCDKTIIEMMPQVLGSIFLKSRKAPVPVTITKKNPSSGIRHALESALLKVPSGSQVGVIIGDIGKMSAEEISENAKAVVFGVEKYFERGDATNRIMAVSLRYTDSPTLPVYTRALEEGAEEEEESEEEGESEEEESDEQPPAKRVKTSKK